MTESDLSNNLVGQKDELLRLCNAGELARAKMLVDFVTPMWVAAGYGYKAGEVNARIVGECHAKIRELEEALDAAPPRARGTRELLRNDIAEYRDLIDRCKAPMALAS